MKLTIAVITMNRAKQLKDALVSCLESDLPAETEFVVLNNGSKDHTSEVIDELKQLSRFPILYIDEPKNLGASLGRNKCFEVAKGEYVYFLDDDAEIAKACHNHFFIQSIQYLDENPSVATLTTEVIDQEFGRRVQKKAKTKTIGGLPCVFTFHEGSVFLRKSAFGSPLFMDIKYGGEGTYVSLRAMDSGYYNVLDSSIFINHYPAANKWKENMDHLNALGVNNIYLIKKATYPRLFSFPLFVFYKLRLLKYGISRNADVKELRSSMKEYYQTIQVNRIGIHTVFMSFMEFGFTTF